MMYVIYFLVMMHRFGVQKRWSITKVKVKRVYAGQEVVKDERQDLDW
jgi:hypothetical protein